MQSEVNYVLCYPNRLLFLVPEMNLFSHPFSEPEPDPPCADSFSRSVKITTMHTNEPDNTQIHDLDSVEITEVNKTIPWVTPSTDATSTFTNTCKHRFL